jgi:hypothetical protein
MGFVQQSPHSGWHAEPNLRSYNMRYTRRLIAILTVFGTWCVAAASAAYAMRPDPVGGDGVIAPPPSGISSSSVVGTPLWKFIAVAAVTALLVLAVVGLISSLRHTRTAGPSRMLRA